MRRLVDEKLFDQPGFPVLFEAWSDVFNTHTDSTYDLDPAAALARVTDARRKVLLEERHLTDESVRDLETIAFRAAMNLPARISEVADEC